MPGDVLLGISKESRGVVIENIPLFVVTQERGFFDDPDSTLNCSRPNHLIRSEHDAITEASIGNRVMCTNGLLSRADGVFAPYSDYRSLIGQTLSD